MFDLLTTQEAERALGQGWQLTWVIDGEKSRVEILPSWTSPEVKNCQQAYRVVTDLAKTRDATALKALQLCVLSRQPTKTTAVRKKKRKTQ